MAVKPIPDGYHTITPYLVVQGAAKLIEFLEQAFGAKVRSRSARPDGTIMNAELRIGDSMIMMGESQGEHKPRPSSIYLYVEDADVVYQRALDAGAKSLMAPADQFYGDRNGGVEDPSGNTWWIGTHMEDVSPEEMEKRMKTHFAEQGGDGK